MLFCRVRIFIIAKKQKIFIIISAFGVSSNGRTRDFGSLYHGSNPCAPTKNQTGLVPVLCLVCGHGDGTRNAVAGSTTSRLDKPCAIKSLRLPRRRRAFMRDTEGTRAPQPPFASATFRAASPICFCVNKLFL